MAIELNKNTHTPLCAAVSSQQGISLISTCVMIMVIGLLMSAIMSFYNIGHNFKAEARTQTTLSLARRALELHSAMHGRFPCPAPLNASIDSPKFGLEIGSNCATAPVVSGETYRVKGREDRLVRIGALPVRTLNIDDNLMFDGHDRRLIYGITEEYAVDGMSATGDRGAIFLQDRSSNVATSVEGNGILVLLSPGRDGNGAYSFNGGLLSTCDTKRESGENCDFQISSKANAVFTASTQLDLNDTEPFVHTSTYLSSEVPACSPERTFDSHAFFVQNGPLRLSADRKNCPPGYTNCTIGDTVFWALHRILPALIDEKRSDEAERLGVSEIFHKSYYGVAQRGARGPTLVAASMGFPERVTATGKRGGLHHHRDYKVQYGGFGGVHVAVDTPNRSASPHIKFPDSPAKESVRRMEMLCDPVKGNWPSRPSASWTGQSFEPEQLEAFLSILGNGVRPVRPPYVKTKKITVIASSIDDMSSVLGRGRGTYHDLLRHHVEVDVIDIRPAGVATDHDITTLRFRQLANYGGGQYYRVNDAEELLKILRKSAGTCALYDPTLDGGPMAGTRRYCR